MLPRALAAVALAIANVDARTFTIVNNCPFTVWPALFTDHTVSAVFPNSPTGWQLNQFAFTSFVVPDFWRAGRIWGRRDCDFTKNVTGPLQCLSGGCNGGLLCDPTTGTGVPPATVAEWTLNAGDNNATDYYDVSLVDGSNLPLSITTNQGCPVAGCFVDLGPNCPPQLKGPTDPTGFVLGCKSACFANLDNAPQNSPNCCSGQFNTPATCPPSNVQFYQYFKGQCPDSYAYAFDESSGTALFACPSNLEADYTVTFCPSNATISVSQSGTNTQSSTGSVSPGSSGTQTNGGTGPSSDAQAAPAEQTTGFVNPTSAGSRVGLACWTGPLVVALVMLLMRWGA